MGRNKIVIGSGLHTELYKSENGNWHTVTSQRVSSFLLLLLLLTTLVKSGNNFFKKLCFVISHLLIVMVLFCILFIKQIYTAPNLDIGD